MAEEEKSMHNVLVQQHVFGLKGDVHGHLHFLDEAKVVYPCGHNVVIYNTETRDQVLIHGMHGSGAGGGASAMPTLHSEGITAMAVTPNRRLIAVAERCSERGVVNLYDAASLKRRRMLNYADLGSREVVWVAFSQDSRSILTLGGAPDWTLVLWTSDRTAKVLATLKLNTQQPAAAPSQPVNSAPSPGIDRQNSTVPSSPMAGMGGAKSHAVVPPMHVRQADFSPADPNVVCVSGNGLLRCLRVEPSGSFRPMAIALKRDPQNFMCHGWLSEDRIVVATDQGDLWLIENFELRIVLPSSPSDGEPITALLPYSKGFVCGGAKGMLRIFERSDDREYYKCSKSFAIEGNTSHPIIELAISQTEDNLACTTTNNQMYSFTLSNTDILKEDSMNFELLTGCAFHGPGPSRSAQITGMAVCSWKPLVATCGKDKSVRVWNYQEKTVDLDKTFHEEPHSIALHPSGLYVLVGFSDMLRLMSLLMEDMRVIREFKIKACSECRFSHGGHFFAAVDGQVVRIFDAYTFEPKTQLKGHQQVVQSVLWAPRDRRLLSVGQDGSIYIWDVRTGDRLKDCIQPRSNFIAAALVGDLSSNNTRVFVAGSDMTLRTYTFNQAGELEGEANIQFDYPLKTLTLAGNGRALFLGTAEPMRPSIVHTYIMRDGKLQVPTDGKGMDRTAMDDKLATGFGPPPVSSSNLDSQSAVSHSSEMSCMSLSHDGNLLFTGGDDGSLCMFEVREVNNNGVVRLQKENQRAATDAGLGVMEFTEEILVTRSDLMERQEEVHQLQQKVEELKLNNDFQLRQKEAKYSSGIKEKQAKFKADLEDNKRKYEKLSDEKAQMELMYEDKLKVLHQTRTKEFQDREKQYNTKIEQEQERRRQLQADRKAQNQTWDQMNTELVDDHTAQLNRLTAEFETKTKSEQDNQLRLNEEKDKLLQDWEGLNRMIESDAAMEVEDVKAKYDQKLAMEKEMSFNLKGENTIMRKQFNVLVKEVREQTENINQNADSEKSLRETLKGLEKDIQGHKKEIREREETIADKEKRIYDLKKKNQELEKFKFVLDYKIKELKRQIEPRENEIADMRKQVEEMDLELEQYHKSNSALDLMIGELRLKMDGMQKEINVQKHAITGTSQYIARFRRDLQGCSTQLDDYKKLKPGVRLLYKQYVQEEGAGSLAAGRAVAGAGSGGDLDLQQEYNRQREHLERNVEALKRNIGKDLDMFMKDHARLKRESVGLTEEMNQLRREAKLLKRKKKAVDLEAAQLPSGNATEITPTRPAKGRSQPGGGRSSGRSDGSKLDTHRELGIQQNHISGLEARVKALQEQVLG